MDDFIVFSGMEAEISKLIEDLNHAKAEVNGSSESAAMSAAQIIQAEQQRLFNKADFKRDKKGHTYNRVNAGLIKISRDQRSKGKVYKLRIGYDAETLRKFPELYVIEFGRPGSTRNRRNSRDKLGRKKGNFPTHISHIRAGLFLAKDKAINAFNEKLMEIVLHNFRK